MNKIQATLTPILDDQGWVTQVNITTDLGTVVVELDDSDSQANGALCWTQAVRDLFK